MATQALHGGVGARKRETCSAVIENSARPLARAMAGLAIGRKASRDMIRVGGLVVFRQMTTDAASIQTGVPSIRMAGRTIHIDMSPAKRESGRCVVKLGTGPTRGGVAPGTIAREPSRRMVGVRCAVIATQVTGRTIGRCACKTVVGMALNARDANVGSRQHKAGSGVMVELRSSPLRSGMASLTGPGEAGRHVTRVGRLVKSR